MSIMIYEIDSYSLAKNMLALSQHAFVLGTLQTEELPFG